MEGVLLQEAQPDHPCNLNGQLLILRQNIGPDELDDLIEAGFLLHGGLKPPP